MKSRSLAAIFIAILAGAFVVPGACGSSPSYLQIVGPPPLRFAQVITNQPPPVLKVSASVAKPQPPKTSLTAASVAPVHAPVEVAEPGPGTASSTAVVKVSAPTAQTNEVSLASAMTKNSEDNAGANSHSNPEKISTSAGDMLTITPQMITQYLKPTSNEMDPNDQSGITVFVPPEMSFTPPLPSTSTESRATYTSQ